MDEKVNMMADNETMKHLQKALHMELTAAHQYQLHAHVLDDWGLDKLAAQMRVEFNEELGHSDKFIDRILFLNGEPNLEFYKKPKQSASLVDMFKSDLADEEEAIKFYTKASQHATEDGDIGTRVLFEEIVLDEEGHKAWLELQISLIERLGERAYSAKYVSGAGSEE